MPLPPVPGADPELPARLRHLGVTPNFVRAASVPPDTLFSPLRLTREATLRDDPPFVALRETFCRPDFHVRWVRDVLLFSDYLREEESDCVMGAGQTTAILYNASKPPAGVGGALDLGCGAGTLALLLARDADHVIATDINPRAIEFTRYNATQNGIGNLEARLGDLYEPLHGQLFDLIVSQPPYYPGTTGPIFLQGGPAGTEIAARLIDGIAEHLAPNGRAVIHTSLPLNEPTPSRPGLHTLEHTPGEGEVEGTRHAVLILTHGAGADKIVIPPAKWGRWPI